MKREPMDPALLEPRLDRTRFSMPTLRGHDQLRQLVDAYGGREMVCRDLLLSPELLDAYLAGEMEPPRTLLLALWWQGPDGFNQAFSETHWTHQAMVARAHLAESRLQQHQLLLQAVAPQVRGMIVLAKTYGIEDLWLVDWAARLRVGQEACLSSDKQTPGPGNMQTVAGLAAPGAASIPN